MSKVNQFPKKFYCVEQDGLYYSWSCTWNVRLCEAMISSSKFYFLVVCKIDESLIRELTQDEYLLYNDLVYQNLKINNESYGTEENRQASM